MYCNIPLNSSICFGVQIFNISIVLVASSLFAKPPSLIKDGVDKLNKDTKTFDKVQLLQLKWLSGNLEEIIKKLKGGQNAKTESI